MHIRDLIHLAVYNIKKSIVDTFHKFVYWCAKNNILFNVYKDKRSNIESVNGPAMYRHFETKHYRGSMSYIISREFYKNIEFVYPKWKTAKIENSVYTLHDFYHEQFMIRMKCEVSYMFIEIENVTPQWVSSITKVNVLENPIDIFKPVSPDTPIERPKYRTATVDIYPVSQYFAEASVTSYEEFSRLKQYFLNRLSNQLEDYLEINYKRNLNKAVTFDKP